MTHHICDCGAYVKFLKRVDGVRDQAICDDCWKMDGRGTLQQAVISELRQGPATMHELVAAAGTVRQNLQQVLTRLMAQGRITREPSGGPAGEHIYRLGRTFDKTHIDIPKVEDTTTLFPHLESVKLPERGEWDGRVVSGPIGPAKFPGRPFRDKTEARRYYARRFEIVDEVNLPVPRYIFRVREKQHAQS